MAMCNVKGVSCSDEPTEIMEYMSQIWQRPAKGYKESECFTKIQN